MKIINLNENTRNQWDKFVLRSRECWFLHLYDWIIICENIFRQKNLSFMVVKDDSVAAIVPLALQKRAFFRSLISPPFSTLGRFVFEENLDENSKMAGRKIITDHIVSIANKHKVDFYEFSDFSAQIGRNNLGQFDNNNDTFNSGAIFQKKQARIIDLKKNENILWDNIKNKTKNDIRIAQKSDLEINEATDKEDVSIFYEILKYTYKETGAKLIAYDYYLALWQHFVQNGMGKILFAVHSQKKIATVFLICFKGISFYLAGGSIRSYRNLRPNHFLQWQSILWSKRSGFEKYLIGIYNPNTKKEKEKNIEFFESRFGGEIFEFKSGIKVFSPLKFKIYKTARYLFNKLLPNR